MEEIDPIPILSWRGSPIKGKVPAYTEKSTVDEESYDGGDLEQYWSQIQTIDTGSVGMENPDEGGLDGIYPPDEADLNIVSSKGHIEEDDEEVDYEDTFDSPNYKDNSIFTSKFVFDGNVTMQESVEMEGNELESIKPLETKNSDCSHEYFSPVNKDELPVNLTESPVIALAHVDYEDSDESSLDNLIAATLNIDTEADDNQYTKSPEDIVQITLNEGNGSMNGSDSEDDQEYFDLNAWEQDNGDEDDDEEYDNKNESEFQGYEENAINGLENFDKNENGLESIERFQNFTGLGFDNFDGKGILSFFYFN